MKAKMHLTAPEGGVNSSSEYGRKRTQGTLGEVGLLLLCAVCCARTVVVWAASQPVQAQSNPRTAGVTLSFGMSVERAEAVLNVKARPHPLVDPPGAIKIISTPRCDYHFSLGGLEKITYRNTTDANTNITPFTTPQYNPPVPSEARLRCGMTLQEFGTLLEQWKKRLESSRYTESAVQRNVGPGKYHTEFNDLKRRWYQVEIGRPPESIPMSPPSGALWFFEFTTNGTLNTISATDLARSDSFVELRQALEVATELGLYNGLGRVKMTQSPTTLLNASSAVDAKAAKMLPPFETELVGPNPVRVRNPNPFSVVAGIRSGQSGRNFNIPAGGASTVFIPDGRYDVFFVYSDKPDALFQGDPINLAANGVEIQLVKVVNGNYGIRQVK